MEEIFLSTKHLQYVYFDKGGCLTLEYRFSRNNTGLVIRAVSGKYQVWQQRYNKETNYYEGMAPPIVMPIEQLVIWFNKLVNEND